MFCDRFLKGATILLVLSFATGIARAELVTIDWVTVGDPANLPDSKVMVDGTAGYGSVNYVYRIAKYEVTNGQYRAFLNAVAKTDTHELYIAPMGEDHGGITRNGEPGSYTYTAKDNDPVWDTKPVNFILFFNTVRFANWIHNGQPSGAQDPTTTEDGAYDMSLGQNVIRKPGARVFLPTENEWYKAAYYKGNGTDAGYWNFATQSDTPPNNNAPPDDTGNSANYYNDEWTIGDPVYTADVGAYDDSRSDYGTFNQNGNVWEWNETSSAAGYTLLRGQRGGAFDQRSERLSSSYRRFSNPVAPIKWSVGFRLATVPEPGTVMLLMPGVVFVMLAALRAKKR